MAILSAEQIAQLLVQVGMPQNEDLVYLTGIARRESGYKTDAWRTDSPGKGTGDVGLWQINHTNLPALRAIGVTSMNQLLDPVTNARAAVYLYSQYGLQPWRMAPGGWSASGNPLYGVNVDAARAAVDSARSRGMLGQPYSGAGAGTPTTEIGGAAVAATGAVQLPADAQIYGTVGFTQNGNYVWAVFDVGGGVKLAYDVLTGPASNWKNFNVQYVSAEQWQQMGVIYAGDVGELGTVNETFGGFKPFWDSILAQVMGPNNPARNDPEIQRVIAEFAARPDMTEAELQNKLQSTQWYQQRTTMELEWNGLSAAEQDKRRQEAGVRAADTWFQYAGERIDPNDPRVVNYIEGLASGKMGWGAFSQIIKQQALGMSESPYAREVRTEQEAQRQRGIDVENTAQNIRQTLERWGIQWTNNEIMSWAKRVVEKVASDDDLMQAIKQQAMVLYPWKDPEMETRQAAQPWLATYERRMERVGSLTDPKIQAALIKGQQPWEFEQDLKRSDEWLGTRNAREEMVSVMSEASKRMGFA